MTEYTKEELKTILFLFNTTDRIKNESLYYKIRRDLFEKSKVVKT
jgi:hypothetical protein